MRRFSEKQKDLYFLSPYVSVKTGSAGILLRQRLFDLEDRLPILRNLAGVLLDGLAAGVTEKQLTDLLEENSSGEAAEDVIRRWMQMGILE